ncbi:hypothetical protein ACVW00_000046 [Marmoricola sp. URHA0025 HA25]
MIHQIVVMATLRFVHAYLGTKDAELACDIPGLMPRRRVMSCPQIAPK